MITRACSFENHGDWNTVIKENWAIINDAYINGDWKKSILETAKFKQLS